jgi:hypothetical protein
MPASCCGRFFYQGAGLSHSLGLRFRRQNSTSFFHGCLVFFHFQILLVLHHLLFCPPFYVAHFRTLSFILPHHRSLLAKKILYIFNLVSTITFLSNDQDRTGRDQWSLSIHRSLYIHANIPPVFLLIANCQPYLAPPCFDGP